MIIKKIIIILKSGIYYINTKGKVFSNSTDNVCGHAFSTKHDYKQAENNARV